MLPAFVCTKGSQHLLRQEHLGFNEKSLALSTQDLCLRHSSTTSWLSDLAQVV